MSEVCEVTGEPLTGNEWYYTHCPVVSCKWHNCRLSKGLNAQSCRVEMAKHLTNSQAPDHGYSQDMADVAAQDLMLNNLFEPVGVFISVASQFVQQ